MKSFDDIVGASWRNNILLTAHLELTYACNLDCTFCYNDRAKQGRALSVADYQVLLDQFADMQVLNLVLSGGEPLVYPGFWQVGAHAKARGFVVRLKTNGHMLKPDVVDRLVDVVDPHVVEVSLHGATAAVHDRQTQVPGSFVRLVDNLRAARDRLRVRINATLTRWNEHEIEAMFALADALGVAMRFDPEVTPKDDGDASPLSLSASSEGLLRLFAAEAARAAQRAPAPAPASPEKACAVDGEKHCGAGSATLLIDPYGDAYPCVQWRRLVGNVHDTPVREIWQGSSELARIRAATIEVKRVLGDKADHCPGIAEELTGSYTGTSTHAATRAAVRKSLPIVS